MKIALIYPPAADPTAPYLSVPALTGYLCSNGVEVLPIDANIEAYCRLLRPKPLGELADRIERRLVSRNAYRELANRLPSVSKRHRESVRNRGRRNSGSPGET
jgi:hypothetical protein